MINGAPGAAGSILNHMDKKAVRKYLDHMADTIQNRIGPLKNYVRAMFTDSMELEGSNWTGDFAEQFRLRRGYDLMPYLPFMMFKVGRLGDVSDYNYGAAKTPEFAAEIRRMRYDFELTKAELLRERFNRTYLDWCKELGVLSRAQAYGRGFFPAGKQHGYRHSRGRVVDDQLAPAPHRRRDAQRRVSCRTRLHDDQQVHHFGCPPYRQTPDQCRRDDQHLPRLQRDARVPQDRLRPEPRWA